MLDVCTVAIALLSNTAAEKHFPYYALSVIYISSVIIMPRIRGIIIQDIIILTDHLFTTVYVMYVNVYLYLDLYKCISRSRTI